MKRMISALGLAILLHLCLFSADFGVMGRYRRQNQPYRRVVTMALFERETATSVAPSPARETRPQPQPTPSPPQPSPIKRSTPKSENPPEPQPKPAEKHLPPLMAPVAKAVESSSDSIAETEAVLQEAESVPVVREAAPMYDRNPPPVYPVMAKRRGYQGTVIVEAWITLDGLVRELRIARSSGYPILDRAAEKAVAGWVFTPGMRGDDAVETWVRVPVRFELR